MNEFILHKVIFFSFSYPLINPRKFTLAAFKMNPLIILKKYRPFRNHFYSILFNQVIP